MKTYHTNFQFQKIDAQSIPYPAHSFDSCIACHMLYHVPDLDQAFKEIYRIIKPNGHFYATTVDESHLKELYSIFNEVNFDFQKKTQMFNDFKMQSGVEIVKKYFSDMEYSFYNNNVNVNEDNFDTLVKYIDSMFPLKYFPEYKQKRRIIQRRILKNIEINGEFRISGISGIIIAKK